GTPALLPTRQRLDSGAIHVLTMHHPIIPISGRVTQNLISLKIMMTPGSSFSLNWRDTGSLWFAAAKVFIEIEREGGDAVGPVFVALSGNRAHFVPGVASFPFKLNQFHNG